MGGLWSSAMEENLKKNQEFMLSSQRMQVERQMQMQRIMLERQMAMQLGRARDLFYWWSAFYVTYLAAATAGFIKKRNPAIIAPVLPFTFILGYQADLALGNKIHRIRDKAERILANESSLLQLPGKMPTIAELDRRSQQN